MHKLPGLIWMLLQTLAHSEPSKLSAHSAVKKVVLDRPYYLALAGMQLAMRTGLP